MSENFLNKNLDSLFQAIDLCLKSKLQLPTLILIYSGIDICGWLAENAENVSVQESFTKWVEKYMLPNAELPCTSIDLYAARCGVLHTLTPDSNLYKSRKAQCIAYAWGIANVDDLRRSIDLVQFPDLIAIHVNSLYDAFQIGVRNFKESIDNDPIVRRIFLYKSTKTFSSMEIETIQEYLKSAQPSPSG
jgi:hypothetical protein